jgi:hypothetical protein
MERNDPPNPHRPDAQSAEPLDALRRLEQRLDRASDAAERLIAEAAARAAGAGARADAHSDGRPDGHSDAHSDGHSDARPDGRSDGADGASDRPPPAGWHSPDAADRSETELLTQVLGALRDLIPPELQRRLAEALRELLLAVRALIDWYLERAERRRAEPTVVQDIPIT